MKQRNGSAAVTAKKAATCVTAFLVQPMGSAKKSAELFPALGLPIQLSNMQLLNMDHLAACIQRAFHLHPLAFELRHFILVVDVIGGAGIRILQHILVA